MGDGTSGPDRDIIVGVLGAGVLVAAMAGVFAYERSQFQSYGIDWQTQEVGDETFDGDTLQEGDSGTHTVSLTAEDLPEGRAMALVEATVTWSDDVGDADTFSVAVQGPGDESGGPEDDDGGSVTATAEVIPEPNATTASGRSPQDAADQAAAQLDAEQGIGEWTVEVTLEDAPGEQGDPGGVTATEDGSNDYSLTVTWHVWEPSVTE